jgi:hypothetical protein
MALTGAALVKAAAWSVPKTAKPEPTILPSAPVETDIATRSETIRAEFHKHISPNATVHTDEAKHYGLVKRDNWEHKFVNHSAEQYVRPDHLTGGPDIHVNGMENFWRNFKSSVRGTHVHISKGHA